MITAALNKTILLTTMEENIAKLASRILSYYGIQAYAEGSIIILPTARFMVAPECLAGLFIILVALISTVGYLTAHYVTTGTAPTIRGTAAVFTVTLITSTLFNVLRMVAQITTYVTLSLNRDAWSTLETYMIAAFSTAHTSTWTLAGRK